MSQSQIVKKKRFQNKGELHTKLISCCTDVDEVTLAVQHNVAIVSVLDLQQKEQKAVGSHAADEVISSLQIGNFLINIFTGLGSASDSHTDSVVTIAENLHKKVILMT